MCSSPCSFLGGGVGAARSERGTGQRCACLVGPLGGRATTRALAHGTHTGRQGTRHLAPFRPVPSQHDRAGQALRAGAEAGMRRARDGSCVPCPPSGRGRECAGAAVPSMLLGEGEGSRGTCSLCSRGTWGTREHGEHAHVLGWVRGTRRYGPGTRPPVEFLEVS